MGGCEGPVSTDKILGEDKECADPSSWGAGTSLASQGMVLLLPRKHPISSASFPSLPIEVSGWNWGYFPDPSQVLCYLPIQSSAGKRSQLMAVMWDVPSASILSPQSTPPPHLSGIPAILPGHSSLCVFPSFQHLLRSSCKISLLSSSLVIHPLAGALIPALLVTISWDSVHLPPALHSPACPLPSADATS